MRIYGIDFTSSPSARKPITVAVVTFVGAALTVEVVDRITAMKGFDSLLRSNGTWVAGIDFPFSQPRKYVESIGWPKSWCSYVKRVAQMSKDEFVREMREYQRERPKGDIRHFRHVDRVAKSCSPMQLDFTPVARMFYAGAPYLLNANCSVYPFLSVNRDARVVLEAYPKLVALCCVGKESYKSDEKKRQTSELRAVRQRIVGALNATHDTGVSLLRRYGITVSLPVQVAAEMVDDGTGDTLDAVLCALQAAWAYSRRESDWGMNWNCDPLEGWIADPSILAQASE